MKMRTVFHLDVSDYPFTERKAMLEVVGSRLLDDLGRHCPEEGGYEIHSETGDEAREGWRTIYLSKRNSWRLRLSLDFDDRGKEKYFRVCMGRDMDKNGLCIMLGMVISMAGLIATLTAGQPFTNDMIAPLLIGTVVGGLLLSLPIRLLIRPLVMEKARKAGIAEGERLLGERVNGVLEHAGLLF